MTAEALAFEQNMMAQQATQPSLSGIGDYLMKAVDNWGDSLVDVFSKAMDKLTGAVGDKVGALLGGESSVGAAVQNFAANAYGSDTPAIGLAREQSGISKCAALAAGCDMPKFDMASLSESQITGYGGITSSPSIVPAVSLCTSIQM